MNAATHLEVQRRASARATHRSPFAAFFLKDLRLAFPILVASLGILGILTAFYAMLPLFGREAERAFLTYQQTALADRLGELSPLFWVVSAIATASRASSVSTALRSTKRRGIRKPSASRTSASPMVTPGETAKP